MSSVQPVEKCEEESIKRDCTMPRHTTLQMQKKQQGKATTPIDEHQG